MTDTITARSPADVFHESARNEGLGGSKPIGDDDNSPASGGDVIARLEAAQARDRGTAAPSNQVPPADQGAPKVPASKPVVPGAPTQPQQQHEDWKPTGKAAEHWERLKASHSAEAATLKAQIAAAQAELKAAREAGGTPEEIKALKEALQEHQNILKDVAIERDPEFQKRWGTKEKVAIDAAKNAVGEGGDKLEKLLKMPASPWRDEQINELIEDLPSSAQRRVNAALGLLEQIDVERSAEIATRRADFEQRQALTIQQQKEQHSARIQELSKAFDAQLASFTDPKAGHPFLVERPGDESYNKEVAASRELASSLHKSFLAGELTPDDIAKAMLHVAVSERMMKTAQEAIARAEKAERALDRRRAATPGDGMQGAQRAVNDDNAPTPGTPEYISWATQRLAEAQAKDRVADMVGGRVL